MGQMRSMLDPCFPVCGQSINGDRGSRQQMLATAWQRVSETRRAQRYRPNKQKGRDRDQHICGPSRQERKKNTDRNQHP